MIERAAHPLAAIVQRDPGAGDRSGARAAIGLNHVAIDGDLALAEPLQMVTARSERPISRWISCVRPDACPIVDSRRVRCGSRGSMEYSAVTQPRPWPRSHTAACPRAGGAKHVGVAEFHEAGALGVAGDVSFERDGAHFVGGASGRAHLSSWVQDWLSLPAGFDCQ